LHHVHLIDEGFEKAKDVLRMNVTERGFSACAIAHDEDPSSNYRSVWARDSAMTLIWSLPLQDPELIGCARASLETILSNQARDGHIPNYVDVATGHAEFGGVGNIAGIDSALWVVIATSAYCRLTGDVEFARRHVDALELTMTWLRAHDSNNCGLLEVPEASDWTDLFPRSYNVLYDEVLWYRANVVFAKLLGSVGRGAEEYINRAARIRNLINKNFWPEPERLGEHTHAFAQTQYSLGRARYLLAQITPFGFSWRCDPFANIIASLYGVLDNDRAEQVRIFMRQVCIDHPGPVKVLYPSIRPGEPDWRDYFLVNLQNLPDHYHNGGIWPFVGGLWVRFLDRLGHHNHANAAIERLARTCQDGIAAEWEFTEWAHGQTGRPMGKAYQAWSAASYVAAYLRFQGDLSIEVTPDRPEEQIQAEKLGLPRAVAEGTLDLDLLSRPAGDGSSGPS
jgi:sucrose-6-phosphatase